MSRERKKNKQTVGQQATLVAFPFPILQVGKRRPLAGWLLLCIGWVCIFGWCLILFAILSLEMQFISFREVIFLGYRYPNEPYSFLSIFIFFGLAAFCVISFFLVCSRAAPRLIIRGRRMRAPRATDILSHYSRLPVVLLRSFDDDDLIDPSLTTPEIAPGRYENRIIKALSAVGPAVALGRPGEPEPELGAARLYVEDRYWQQAIGYLIKHAKAVVVIVGLSSGLWWRLNWRWLRSHQKNYYSSFPTPCRKRFAALIFDQPFLNTGFLVGGRGDGYFRQWRLSARSAIKRFGSGLGRLLKVACLLIWLVPDSFMWIRTGFHNCLIPQDHLSWLS
jgi:hypothetical protein